MKKENALSNPEKLKQLDREVNRALDNGDVEKAKELYNEGDEYIGDVKPAPRNRDVEPDFIK